jgi:predicted transcriptional regulator
MRKNSVREELLSNYYTISEVAEKLGYTKAYARAIMKEKKFINKVNFFKGLQLVEKDVFDKWANELIENKGRD